MTDRHERTDHDPGSRTLWILTAFVALLCAASAHAATDPEATLSLGLSKIFTFFFLTLGPKAVIAPFARTTAALDTRQRNTVAILVTIISLFSIIVAATIGVRVLTNWGVSTGALLVAAGIILFLIALESIRSQYQVAEVTKEADRTGIPLRRMAFKLAFPYVVSPHGVAVVILVLTSRPANVPIEPIIAMLGGMMLLNLLVMIGARKISGSPYIAPVFAIVGAVLAVLQAALGVQAVLVGLRLAGVIGGAGA
jgi:multiple antibiotic resistance protein